MNRKPAMLGYVAAAIGAVVGAAGAMATPPPANAPAESPADASVDSRPARAAELRRDARQMRDLARILEEQGKTEVAAQLREDASAAEAEADRLTFPAAIEPPADSPATAPVRPGPAEDRGSTPVGAGARRGTSAPPALPNLRPADPDDDPLSAVDLMYEAAAKLRAAGMRREAARVTRLALEIEASVSGR